MTVQVLIVDDSVFYQRCLAKLLQTDPQIKVIGFAANGQEAVEKTHSLKPDIVTMDIEMPVMDGITAVRRIMSDNPTPVLMISAATKRGAKATFDALDAGAVDYFTKETRKMSDTGDLLGNEIRQKVISIARSTQKTTTSKRIPEPKSGNVRQSKLRQYHVLAIGASTGGPIVVQKLLTGLSAEFPMPVIIVQHMPGTFTPMYSERMNQLCAIKVKHAENGDVLMPGCAYIAPGGMQTTVKRNAGETILQVTTGDDELTYKPSIDVTYESLAKLYPGKVLAMILTGMGSDGCEGARQLKQGGSEVWAQDENSSVVYGMPMAVARAGLADQVLSIDSICSELAEVQ